MGTAPSPLSRGALSGSRKLALASRARTAPPLLLALGLGALGGGCKSEIGDACKRSQDCSLQGERTCDLSYRIDENGIERINGNGECTIDGCSRGSCPEEAACVKSYSSAFVSTTCDASLAAVGSSSCRPSEVCLPEGLCADELTARTSCRFVCENSSDCRPGYTCSETGSGGVYRAPDPSDPSNIKETRICVPAV